MGQWEYAEQILHVDLSQQTTLALPTPLGLKRAFIGGAGFVARLLADVGPDTAAVAMAAGPLSDEEAGRLAIGSRPAAGNTMSMTNLGGRMAAALKSAGYDAVVITGQLPNPGYLTVGPQGVQLLPADDLWGMEVPATEAIIRRRYGANHATLVLGPAGENLVPFATVAHEGHYAGGGNSGIGAMLGAMRLKAIVVEDRSGMTARCSDCATCTFGCHKPAASTVDRAGALGLDAFAAGRLELLLAHCSAAGLLPPVADPLAAIAHREGLGSLLDGGESALLGLLGERAEEIVATLPKPRKHHGIGTADLLGTCQRGLRDRPGAVLREALSATLALMKPSI